MSWNDQIFEENVASSFMNHKDNFVNLMLAVETLKISYSIMYEGGKCHGTKE